MLLDSAHWLARRIADAAIETDAGCAWELHVPTHPDPALARIETRAAGPTLYLGGAGIALFLREAAAETGDAKIGRVASAALRQAVADGERLEPGALAFHRGRVGIASVAVRAAELTGDDEWLDAADRLLAPIVGREREDRGLDVMSGAAGAIPALLAMSRRLPAERTVDVAVALGEHLLRTAERGPRGWSWRDANAVQVRNLAGMAHGAAGTGHALLELFRATGDGRFLYAGEQAFVYERGLFDAARQNWPDLRHVALNQYQFRSGLGELRARLAAGETLPPYEPTFMAAWCHGAPGITLTRLRAWQTTGRTVYRDEAIAGLATTRAALTRPAGGGPAAFHSLCHGVAGNAWVLMEAADLLGDRWLKDEATDRTLAALGEYRSHAERPDAPPADPGLMLGEAGIGLFLLRLRDERIPSPLLPISADATPSVDTPTVLAAADGLRRETIHAWLGRSLRAWSRLRSADWTPPPIDSEPREDVVEAVQAMHDALSAETDSSIRERMADVLAVEEARFAAADGLTDRTALLLREMARPDAASIDWSSTRLVRPSTVRIVHQRWDWDAWPAAAHTSTSTDASADSAAVASNESQAANIQSTETSEPPEQPVAFAVVSTSGGVRVQRLAPLAAAVLEALAEPASPADLARRIAADADGAAAAPNSRVINAVAEQARQLYAVGMIDVA